MQSALYLHCDSIRNSSNLTCFLRLWKFNGKTRGPNLIETSCRKVLRCVSVTLAMSCSGRQLDGLKAARLVNWFTQAGITYTGVELFSDTDVYGIDAYGLRAIDAIAEGDVIATIPKDKVISGKTSSLGPFLEDNKLGGGSSNNCFASSQKSMAFIISPETTSLV